jgi:hypothetical protein
MPRSRRALSTLGFGLTGRYESAKNHPSIITLIYDEYRVIALHGQPQSYR